MQIIRKIEYLNIICDEGTHTINISGWHVCNLHVNMHIKIEFVALFPFAQQKPINHESIERCIHN